MPAMRRTEQIANLAVWLFLICSISFLAYLFPLPSTGIETAMSSLPTSTTGGSASDVDVKQFIERSFWLSWTTNLTLMISGTLSAALWITSRSSRTRKWTAIALAMVFVLLCGLILLAQVGGSDSWIERKTAFLKQLMSAGIWTYVAAEVHRLISSLVSVIALILMMSLAILNKEKSTQT
jgi:hypothetical protein